MYSGCALNIVNPNICRYVCCAVCMEIVKSDGLVRVHVYLFICLDSNDGIYFILSKKKNSSFSGSPSLWSGKL